MLSNYVHSEANKVNTLKVCMEEKLDPCLYSFQFVLTKIHPIWKGKGKAVPVLN